MFVGLLALASLLALGACDPSPQPAPTPSSGPPRDPEGNPVGGASPSPQSTYRATIPGASIAQLTAWWTQRWKVPIEQHGYEFSATVESYADHGRFSVAAVQANGNRTDAPRSVFCVIVKAGLDDQASRRALVDGCLAPALQAAEAQAVPAWLYAQTVPDNGVEVTKQFPRFTAAIMRGATSVSISIRTDAP